jgi:hypothetical protein
MVAYADMGSEAGKHMFGFNGVEHEYLFGKPNGTPAKGYGKSYAGTDSRTGL